MFSYVQLHVALYVLNIKQNLFLLTSGRRKILQCTRECYMTSLKKKKTYCSRFKTAPVKSRSRLLVSRLDYATYTCTLHRYIAHQIAYSGESFRDINFTRSTCKIIYMYTTAAAKMSLHRIVCTITYVLISKPCCVCAVLIFLMQKTQHH